MPTSTEVIQVLERRIASGDYTLQGIPGERVIAEEIGVSRMTARRAIQQLVKRGVLARKTNGRITVQRLSNDSQGHKHIAYLAPAFASSSYERNRIALEQTALDYPISIRPVSYVHWDDPIVVDTLENFDAVFISRIPELIPQRLVERFQIVRARVAFFDPGQAIPGVPMIDLLPPNHFQSLLEHLGQLGHRCVGCINIHPHGTSSVLQRIEQWKLWSLTHGGTGRLLDQPHKPFEKALDYASGIMNDLIGPGPLKETAFFCTTGPAALAAMRIMQQRGLVIGRDVSLVTIDDLRICRHLWPALTCLSEPDPHPFVRALFEWIMHDQGPWPGPTVLQPGQPLLSVGESTSPCPTSVS